MTKKLSKKSSIYQKMKDIIRRNKHESLVVAILLVVVALLLTTGLYTQYMNKLDKDRVVTMRNTTQMIRDLLFAAEPDYKWMDSSYCTVIAAKAFEETTAYSCTSHYQSSKAIKGQMGLDDTIDLHIQTISHAPNVVINEMPLTAAPLFTNDSEILDKPSYRKVNQAAVYEFRLDKVKPAKCTIQYELINDELKMNVLLQSDLNCFMVTKEAYFQPVNYKQKLQFIDIQI